MHEALQAQDDIGPLRDPVLIAAFSGWGDAGGSAVGTLQYLEEQWDAKPLATLDPQFFYDFTVQRPRVRLEHGERTIDWPAIRFLRASPPGAERDFVLLSGAEPSLRWRTFTEAVADLMQTVGVTVSITLGAQPAAVPHTRPVPVNLSASHSEFEQMLGLQVSASRYQGPTGIVGVMNLDHRARGWRNASLWALVPHYLTMGPHPDAAISLVKSIDRGFGTATPLDTLEERRRAFGDQVREMLAQNSDAADYVRQLEEQYDANRPALPAFEQGDAPGSGGELPSAENLLSDLERFLKERREEGNR